MKFRLYLFAVLFSVTSLFPLFGQGADAKEKYIEKPGVTVTLPGQACRDHVGTPDVKVYQVISANYYQIQIKLDPYTLDNWNGNECGSDGAAANPDVCLKNCSIISSGYITGQIWGVIIYTPNTSAFMGVSIRYDYTGKPNSSAPDNPEYGNYVRKVWPYTDYVYGREVTDINTNSWSC